MFGIEEYDLLTSAYSQGKNSFNLGKEIDTVPFPKYSEEWNEWLSGYSAAEFNARTK